MPLIHVNIALGTNQFKLNLAKDSERSFKRTLKICTKRPNLFAHNIVFCENHIGLIKCKGRDYKHAVKHFKESLDVAKKYCGEGSMLVGDIYNYLGGAYTNRGKFQKALDKHQKALQIFLNSKNQQLSEGVSNSYFMIAAAHFEQKNYEKSQENYEKALLTIEKIFGNDHVKSARILICMGDIQLKEVQHKKAMEHYEKAEEIYQRCLKLQKCKEDDLAAVYNKIGGVYAEQSEQDKALEFYEKSLNLMLKTHNKDSLVIGLSYFNIAIIKYYKSDFKKSIEYHKKALAIRTKIFGSNNYEIGSSHKSMAILYYDMKLYQLSLKHCQKAVAIFRENKNKSDSSTEVQELQYIIKLILERERKQKMECVEENGFQI